MLMPATTWLLYVGLFSMFLVWLWDQALRRAARSGSLAGKKFRQRPDDAVGLDGGARRQAIAMHVDPDGVDAETLRGYNFPFQIVADHPGLGRGDAERFHRVQIGALLRLAKAMLAFDLDMIEAVRQRQAFDLGALRAGGAVGHQRQFDAEFLERVDRVMRAREDEHLLFAIGVEAVGETCRQVLRQRRMALGGQRVKSTAHHDV